MTDRMATPFECIDPAVGDRLWQLQRTDLAPHVRELLQAHVQACHACRLVVRLDERAQELGRAGRLGGRAHIGANGRRGRARWGFVLAFAASLIAILAVPPRPATGVGEVRGAEAIRFTSPVEGQVLVTGRPELRWTSVPGATRYAIEVRDGDGRVVWSGQSSEPRVRLSDAATLAAGRDYRALLTVRPADLAGPVPASVGFRRDSFARMLLHRARWAPPLLQVLALGSLALVALGAAWPRRRRAYSNGT